MSGKRRSDVQPPLTFGYEEQGAEEDYVRRPEWSKDPIRERTDRERYLGAEIIRNRDQDQCTQLLWMFQEQGPLQAPTPERMSVP